MKIPSGPDKNTPAASSVSKGGYGKEAKTSENTAQQKNNGSLYTAWAPLDPLYRINFIFYQFF